MSALGSALFALAVAPRAAVPGGPHSSSLSRPSLPMLLSLSMAASLPTPAPAPLARSKSSAASPFAFGLAGRLFGGHRAAARSSSSAAAVFERRFAAAATKNSGDGILTNLVRPGGGSDFGK